MVEGCYKVTSSEILAGFRSSMRQGDPKEINWRNESKLQQPISAWPCREQSSENASKGEQKRENSQLMALLRWWDKLLPAKMSLSQVSVLKIKS